MAQFCSREAWRGLPRLFAKSYFSILSTGLQRVGQFSFYFREHKTYPKSLSGLRVQPGPTSPPLESFWGKPGKVDASLPYAYSPRKWQQKQEKAGPRSYAFLGEGKKETSI